MSNSATYAERDRQFHFHAYTNARQHETCGPMIIERGEGIYVWDQSGKRYIEAMSGLWSVAVGFGERRLVEAATRQMEKAALLPQLHSPQSWTGYRPGRETDLVGAGTDEQGVLHQLRV